MFLASSVMALGFYRRVREMEVLFRAAIAFAVTWVVVFVASTIIKHIVLRELERRRRDEAAAEEQAAKSTKSKTEADDSYEQLGGT